MPSGSGPGSPNYVPMLVGGGAGAGLGVIMGGLVGGLLDWSVLPMVGAGVGGALGVWASVRIVNRQAVPDSDRPSQ